MIHKKRPVLKVVKIGGKLIENEKKLQAFLADFSAFKGPKILVHGGGILATALTQKLGLQTKMIDGRRITDKNAMQVITMTYSGINKTIVAYLRGLNCNALGLCGADGGSIISKKREVREIDYGFVGDVEEVNTTFISSLLKQNIYPVFSAISCTREGQLLNTNADSVATEIAKAMSKEFETELYFCFEKQGVLKDMNDENSVIEVLNTKTYKTLLDNGEISDGMLPKLHNCFRALEDNISGIFLGNAGLLQKGTSFTKIIR